MTTSLSHGPAAEPRPLGALDPRRLAHPASPVRLSHPLVRTAVEVALVVGFFLVYELGRRLARGRQAEAFEHASAVHHLERMLHLPSEAAIQGAIHSAQVFRLANHYYVSMHFTVAVAFVAWGFLRRSNDEYRWARNLLAVQTGAALAIHVVFPLAPPRMFPQWGFVDTMQVYGPSAYGGANDAIANQFAAMPSLHIGWAVLIAYVVARTSSRLMAVLAALYAATTTVVVIITANHWLVDGVVAVALLAVAAWIVPGPRQRVSDDGGTPR
ncbi:phosphatase PAP2 family protein [Cellulomonas sp. PhB143]|uniref:phosphatase PAP2 family protein n=1 Tax=Cellulomonas sp. PhB143 TaxID=2485186 RepID=UPI000F4935A0|nr:phosphatase PAP2 family protein [Cellulomonas sp. PhB143]ROS75437.1 PAP2 superfamily protein [Cellulomonas sp. PhB143]